MNNYMYCDVHGEYGYRLRGKIPIRSNDAGSCNPHDHLHMIRNVFFACVPLMILQGMSSYDLPRNHI